MSILHSIAAFIAAVAVSFVVGCTYRDGTAKKELRALQDEMRAAANVELEKAYKEKYAVEDTNRKLNKDIGDALDAKRAAIDAAIDAVGNHPSERLRVTVCRPAAETPTAEAAADRPSPDGTGTGRRFDARTVDLEDVAGEIRRLGADRDKCAAKVKALQLTADSYERALRAYTDGK